MSDDMERTEAATPKKRQDAHEEGRIPKSQDLTTAVLLLGAAVTLRTAGPNLAHEMLTTFGAGLSVGAAPNMDATSAVKLVQGLGWRTLLALGGFLASMAGTALVISAVQARGVMSTKPIAPDFNRINPAPNIKRMLGVQPWMELLKSLLKMLIVAWAVYTSLRAAWPEIMALGQQPPRALIEVVRRYGVGMLMTAGLAYLALAGADYLYQLWDFEKNLRMSKEEIKQESKQSDGDPMVKARMRSIGRARARKQMFKDVPQADVVIVNPTHIAIALKYDPDKAPAPYVLAAGQRKVAERIKKLAFESGVPVIENRPLARALIASVKVGTMIPADLYLAVAEVLAFVMRQRAEFGERWRGTAVA
jgi:flagellar biosynthesis protein FlhB